VDQRRARWSAGKASRHSVAVCVVGGNGVSHAAQARLRGLLRHAAPTSNPAPIAGRVSDRGVLNKAGDGSWVCLMEREMERMMEEGCLSCVCIPVSAWSGGTALMLRNTEYSVEVQVRFHPCYHGQDEVEDSVRTFSCTLRRCCCRACMDPVRSLWEPPRAVCLSGLVRGPIAAGKSAAAAARRPPHRMSCRTQPDSHTSSSRPVLRPIGLPSNVID
jgi:hypothetical protein